jgi:hypothetical protein
LLSWVPIIGDPLTIVAGALCEPFPIFLALVALAKTLRYVAVAATMSQVTSTVEMVSFAAVAALGAALTWRKAGKLRKLAPFESKPVVIISSRSPSIRMPFRFGSAGGSGPAKADLLSRSVKHANVVVVA